MLNAHSRVGIAQIAIYAPAIALAIFLFLRHGRPRMTWALLLLFSGSKSYKIETIKQIRIDMSTVRLGGGVVVILLGNDPKSKSLIITAIVLLNTGVAPLIVATLGLVRIV